MYELFGELLVKRRVPFWLFREAFVHWVPRRLAYSVSKQDAAKGMRFGDYVTRTTLRRELAALRVLTDTDLLAPAFGKVANGFFGVFAAACGRRRWCVKAPTYIYPNIDLVFRIHPDMKFIHIVRDGRDVVASIMRQPWARRARDRFAYALSLWLTLEEGDAKASGIPAASFFRVRLEDMVRDEDRVRALCAFLGEEYGAELGDYYARRVSSNEAHAGRWRSDLTSAQIDQLERVGGALLARHGYAS